jgi:hypothetical protein
MLTFDRFLEEQDFYSKLSKDVVAYLKQQPPHIRQSLTPYLKGMMQDYDRASRSRNLAGQNFEKSPELAYLMGLTGQIPPIVAQQQWNVGNVNTISADHN